MGDTKPPKVADHYEFWLTAPDEPSPRCLWWVEEIRKGWRPNRRIAGMGYDSAAQWFGVFMWEYLCIIWPLYDGVPRNNSYPYPEWATALLDRTRANMVEVDGES